ncbi:hypothetical protein [Streptomyces sp. ISL-36]|uniref:hypothetical protein n=1 Tax=Streptomyces sp. ISL-36 TaxID=2819182 RepID=UPI0020351CFC|nr:hypothetical protein [Streptomyces sp. ISL-36]
MSRHLRLALVQTPEETFERFAEGLRLRMKSPNAADLVVYPEAHLYSLSGVDVHRGGVRGLRGAAGRSAREGTR